MRASMAPASTRGNRSSTDLKMEMSLSFLDINLDRDGQVMSREQIKEERMRKGFCTECQGVPIRLVNIKKSKLNPFYSSRIPCTEPGKSLNGQCLRCYPELDPDKPKRKTKVRKTLKRPSEPRSASMPNIQQRNTRINPRNRDMGESLPEGRLIDQTEGSFQEPSPTTPGLVSSDDESKKSSLSGSSNEKIVNGTSNTYATQNNSNNNVARMPGEEPDKDDTQENFDDDPPDGCEIIFAERHKKSSKRLVRQPSIHALGPQNELRDTNQNRRSKRNLVDDDNSDEGDVTPLVPPRREQSDAIPQPPVPHREISEHLDEQHGGVIEQQQQVNFHAVPEHSQAFQPIVSQLPNPPMPDEQSFDRPIIEEPVSDSTPPVHDSAQLIAEMETLVKDIQDTGNCDFAIDILLQNLKNYSDDVDIQEYCLSAIWDLCKDDDNYKQSVASSTAPDDILLVMMKHLDRAGVQERGCGTLWCLCNDPDRRMIVIRAGATARVVKALVQHIYDVDVVLTGIGCLRTLSPEYEARETMGALSGIEHVCKAMSIHKDVSTIQRDGCAFLSNCAVDVQKQQVSLASDCEIEAVTNAIATHRENMSVLSGACFALKNYTFEERNVRRLKKFTGVFRLLEDICQLSIEGNAARDASIVLERIHNCEDIDKEIEELMLNSTLDSMIEDATVDPDKKVQQVIDLMDEYDWSCKVLSAVFQKLTLLYQYYPLQRSMLESSRVMHTAIVHMKTYKSFPAIQVNGCKLFSEILTNADSLSSTILDADGCGVIMDIVLDHESNVEAQIAATSVLKTLSKEFDCCFTMMTTGFSIEDVMAAHPENQLIQDNGLEIVTNLSFHGMGS